MRYTFGQAEAFYWVARLGGFRAAAAHLNLSQPTVSLRVKELERILGGELFDRSLYRPVPTSLGASIYGDVERMLAHAELVQRRSREDLPGRGLLRIGAADSFAARILPDLLAAIAARHPSLQVDVTVDFSTRLEQLLLDRAIDIAFLSQPRAHEKIVITPLWQIDLVWVVGRHLAFDGDVATPEKLVGLPIFTNSPPSGLFTTIQMWFGTRGLKPLRLNTCNPLTVIARLANAGTGAALLPREILSFSGAGLDLRVLEADPPVGGHHLCAMWWDAESAGEYAYLADMARHIALAQADHSAKSKSG
ncbi:LysR family transcriptional regulator [Chelatococcus asaccharovorans]|uniref:DNA-binding transcriptional LysR family regulator n=1 Tax=Chelatococcus asaccharovorans TaxID=28210 RepID=A0A2V3U997_9HYPH|nr:LysR family transcriptional regulator [Chelatococcus asaccharovorans]MBS7705627.1 LysR family transcriptional regulator [Chelatococcus asaccharovorans]PXW59960.1 DNA-binding transcriptional LysR family regulator [Chelatococcus asaccharovorans]CAH1656625.1 DNA-binding transcriptional LysR family regulator [Chelatococcus asaccharovorans]CAH1685047.1 DNA-binding transcriptional LysR family regulator [Chelatococcus asaccharovorans]